MTQSTELWAKRRKTCRVVSRRVKWYKKTSEQEDKTVWVTVPTSLCFFDTSRKSFLFCFWEASAKNKLSRDQKLQAAYNYPLVLWSCQSLQSACGHLSFAYGSNVRIKCWDTKVLQEKTQNCALHCYVTHLCADLYSWRFFTSRVSRVQYSV